MLSPHAIAGPRRNAVITKLLLGLCLMGVSVAIHAAGLASALRHLQRRPPTSRRFWPVTMHFIGLAGWIILLHLTEIVAWATLYRWRDAMPDLPTAIYFSAVTYTTTGYGDLVLPPEWRLVGGIEALTGILMCGLSTGFFFAVVGRVYQGSSNRQESTDG
jgi:hypothetical protein